MKPIPNPAMLGNLNQARELLARGAFEEAWQSAVAAVRERPFHPEAVWLAGEIAQAAGDSATARLCFERAIQMAPGFKGRSRTASNRNGGDGAGKSWVDRNIILEPRPTDRLSVCLIVKNEETFLGQCLASVKDIAFEMIVVDTGSTDRTVDIAREMGARVVDFAWMDDFSAARNAGLVCARGDWIVVLDADEELLAASREPLRREMLDSKAVAFYLQLVNKGREAEGTTPLARMFRNLPGAAYEGRIHEQVFESVIQRARGWGLEYPQSKAVILHHGYSAELTVNRDKVQRNLRLLKQAIHEPGATPLARAYLWMNLGLETVRANDLEAGIAHYRQSLDLVQEQLKGGNRPSPEFRATLLRQLSTHLVSARRYQEVVDLFASPLAVAGSLASSDHYARGLAFMELGRIAEAAEQFKACLAKRNEPDTIAVNTGIFTVNPHHCLAIALARLHRFSEAEQVCAAAQALFPDSQEIQLFRAKLAHFQGRSVDALKALNQMLTRWGGNPEVWLLGGEIALSQPQFREFGLDWTGEAMKLHAREPRLIAQRLELLLLANATDQALELPRSLTGPLDPRALAVMIYAGVLAGDPAAVTPANELSVSQIFLDLYRRLIDANAAAPIQRMNLKLDVLGATLPTAARLLKTVVGGVGKG
jgi:tetratricopeptide (TPR) repeat protein